MNIRSIKISDLLVNRANDRHGELENETAAIAWLFNARETHMKNLAKDIVNAGRIYEPPLVNPEGSKFVVFDGNRRVTCLKLLADPKRAPNVELQEFFQNQRDEWEGDFPETVPCQVEKDREVIDETLFRRHTGSQKGVGQSTWDDRMKSTFVSRTGKGSGSSVADEIETRLRAANLLPTKRKIPRSTMNRLLSAEPFRNRVGISVQKGRFILTHSEEKVLPALARIANDMASRKLVLGKIWDADGKKEYLDALEAEGLLPSPSDKIEKQEKGEETPKPRPKPIDKPKPHKRTTLFPKANFGIVWPGRLQRHRQIWEELQFHLELATQPNAISVLFRVLLELSIENYISQTGLSVHDNDKLAVKLIKVAKQLEADGKIDRKQMSELNKFQQADKLVSADTLNRYVHSPQFAPSKEHLASMWDTLSNFIVLCLKA